MKIILEVKDEIILVFWPDGPGSAPYVTANCGGVKYKQGDTVSPLGWFHGNYFQNLPEAYDDFLKRTW